MTDINIRDVPPELLQVLKIEAARENVTLKSLISSILEDWIDARPAQKKVRR